MNFDAILFIIFILIITIFLYIKRKKVELQKLMFPLFYMVLYRTNFGIRWMQKISKKHNNLVKLFGYSAIGFGFLGMIFISISMLFSMIQFFIAPKATELGVVLVLPGTNIPGIGFLSFFHFLISILILAIVHEFSHGVVSEAHNLKIKSSGFAFLGILFPIIPAAFVEPDEKKMSKKEDIVQYSILSAGPISNILLSVVFLFLFLQVLVPIENAITDPIGISFDIIEDKPAAIAGLTRGTIINSFNGDKITNYNSFLDKMNKVKPNQAITLGSDDNTYEITTIAHPDYTEKGFIGINSIKNEGEIKKQYKRIGPSFLWIKGLVKWLYLLNIFVGLINLLPIYITDGAKMLLVALQGSFKNKKRAIKIWRSINTLFVLLILIGLAATYLKRFGLF